MRALKMDHVGIVVKDLAAALETYSRNFGFAADSNRGGDVPAMGIKNAFMPVGDTNLEFVKPTTDEGPVAKFARERGEGLFWLSIAVDDVAAAVEHLRALGVRASDVADGVAYVSMKSSHGVHLQLIQR